MFHRMMIVPVVVVLLVLSAAEAPGQILVKPPKQGRPEIWKTASEAGTSEAEAAATTDATTRLVAAVYMLPVSSARDVYDMMLKNDQVNRDLVKALKGAKVVRVKYLEDGTARVTVQTTPREVMAILKKAYEKVDWDLAEEDATIAAVARRTKATTKITATGEGALPGSPAAKRIPIRRAALLKGERALALDVMKLVIRDDETWRNRKLLREYALAFQQVPKKIALGLSTTRIANETWNDDGSVKMRVELDVIHVSQLVYRSQVVYDKRRRWAEWGIGYLPTWTKDMIFKKDAAAGPRDPVPADGVLSIELRAVDEAIKITPEDAPKKKK